MVIGPLQIERLAPIHVEFGRLFQGNFGPLRTDETKFSVQL
jgi:hypothetical protein